MAKKKRVGIHAATINSPRLKRVMKVLKGKKRFYSTLEIQERAKTCAVGTCISELRARGINIPRAFRHENIYYYELR